jgi:hypothetical protein
MPESAYTSSSTFEARQALNIHPKAACSESRSIISVLSTIKNYRLSITEDKYSRHNPFFPRGHSPFLLKYHLQADIVAKNPSPFPHHPLHQEENKEKKRREEEGLGVPP